jgi:hypothetical protein
MADETSSLVIASPSSGEWQTTAAPAAVVEVSNDSTGSTKSLEMVKLIQNTDICPS